jgi:2-keto-4-pentenoate hydratase/2-oxohepta-3-ene-1,7-dioic acid hydratase in catechol pathway
MRVARVLEPDGPVWAMVEAGYVEPLSVAAASTASLIERAFARSDQGWSLLAARGGRSELDERALLAPIVQPGKIVGIGLNYEDHAAESGITFPAEPLVFAKFGSSVIGPRTAIRWNEEMTNLVDFEAELGVVIGRGGRDIAIDEALGHVFGYTCLNDVSARDLQFGDGQWVRAKSFDTFCPVGPWIVTTDEIPDPQVLSIECRVSGETLQSATTSDMHFNVAQLVSWLSRFTTLEVGDVLATGTPPGVGYFREPRRMLRNGDVVEVEIGGIGVLRNPVETYANAPGPLP